ncbi:early growth response factor homolog 1-like [Schistocerca piceifrons]|uniref:early growth response factor homolog 1-like n=1 Tax=Schistocerca piceifrons TaxID=274613 RepID=UPI001F5EC332|nr:early growth response factor homolog 1-like [Schistocerca piceifrons]
MRRQTATLLAPQALPTVCPSISMSSQSEPYIERRNRHLANLHCSSREEETSNSNKVVLTFLFELCVQVTATYIYNFLLEHSMSTQFLQENNVFSQEQLQWSTATKERNFSCTRCHNTYTRRDNLLRHMRFECGVEPQFQCPVCYKRARHKYHLISHMKRHNRTVSFE